MKTKIKNLQIRFNSINTAILEVEIGKNSLAYLPPLDKELTVEIKEYKKNRSLNSNALMWEVCERIAKKIDSTKEDVYRQAVRTVGACFATTVASVQADGLIKSWSIKGVGWIAEKISENNGLTDILLYAGSSTYTTEQMARLINYLIDECEELGVEIDTNTFKT